MFLIKMNPSAFLIWKELGFYENTLDKSCLEQLRSFFFQATIVSPLLLTHTDSLREIAAARAILLTIAARKKRLLAESTFFPSSIGT